jgi:hypothetical protein
MDTDHVAFDSVDDSDTHLLQPAHKKYRRPAKANFMGAVSRQPSDGEE